MRLATSTPSIAPQRKTQTQSDSNMRISPTILVILGAVRPTFAKTNASAALSAAAQSLFDYSMTVQDARWDDYYKYIRYQETAGELSTRFTAWYAAGLLARKQGADVENAKAALENILSAQMSAEYDSAWYGTWKVTLENPVPTDNSSYWPPKIYSTYDPNWREFIGSQLVQIVELYSDDLGDELVSRIEDSLEIAAVGQMRRNGTFPDGDNLVLAYSNPALMRCLTVGWIGARRNNSTFTAYANEQGILLLELFKANGSNTLGEYNAPTYYGMDIWALAANIAYGPGNATLTTNAKYILTELWKDIADHYNPYLRNLAGPYDRAYTRDMTVHSAVLSLWWWGLFGREYGGQPPLGDVDVLYDVAQGAALALVMDTASQYITNETAAALKATGMWNGSRLLNKTIRTSLDTDILRVATSYISAEVMVGAVTVAEDVNRGDQFVPAIVHWAADPERTPVPGVGFFSLYPSASTIEAVAGERSLRVAYPNNTQDGTGLFTFALSGLPPSWVLGGAIVEGLENLPCLSVKVEAPGLERLPVTASSGTLKDHYYYNISYLVPDAFEGVPSVNMDFEYTC